MKVFPLNHLLYTAHDGIDLIHRERFSVNRVFCAQPQKFLPLKHIGIHTALYGHTEIAPHTIL